METQCEKCVCSKVCKYRDMGIEKIEQNIELDRDVQKLKDCLEIEIRCKNYVESRDAKVEKLSK